MTSILAVGDSITEGYLDNGANFRPYTAFLQKILNQNNKKLKKPKIEITNIGKSGATSREIRDLVIMYTRHKPKKFFDFAIVLAGLNDIDTYVHQKIPLYGLVNEIIGICTVLLKQKVKIVYLLTLPVVPLDEQYSWYQLFKHILNQELRKSKSEKIVIIDIAEQISYINMSQQDKITMWSDSIHYSEAGYKLLAQTIFNNMVEKESIQDDVTQTMNVLQITEQETKKENSTTKILPPTEDCSEQKE
jgi:lysophospholipase L1-like esterase